jgi:hypothetical protein
VPSEKSCVPFLFSLDYDFRDAVALLERWLNQYQAQLAKEKPPTTSHRS